MKTTKWFFLLLLSNCIYSCQEKLPDSYGIYVDCGNDINALAPQKLMFKGNFLSSISGIKEASGISYTSIDGLIVFEKDVNPNNIVLSKLKFQDDCEVQDLLSRTYIKVKLWTADCDIPIKIAPVDGKSDMYRIMPHSQLQAGFYALHFGELANKETLSSIDKVVYGFVVGNSIKPYQSSENSMSQGVTRLKLDENESSQELYPDYSDSGKNQQEFYDNAKLILDKANEFFNKKSYFELRKIYLNSDESKVNNSEWDKLTIGFKNWSQLSGRIKASTITNWNYEENKGTFEIQTEYEKVGLVNEILVVIYKDNIYYITFIGTKSH